MNWDNNFQGSVVYLGTPGQVPVAMMTATNNNGSFVRSDDLRQMVFLMRGDEASIVIVVCASGFGLALHFPLH